MNKIINGDSLKVLKKLEDESVDLICTDPPYGYSFMGKDWDKVVPSVEIWKECLRVLKPGGFCFVMSAPRIDVQSRMATKLEDAGFQTNFSPIYWTYATGFPKASNVGKAVDKRAGRIGVSVEKLKLRLIELFNESGKTRTKVDKECGFRASNYLTLEKDGKRPDPWINILPSEKKWERIKEVLGLDGHQQDELNSFFKEAQREVVETKTKARAKNQKFAMPTLGEEVDYVDIDYTTPSSDKAKALDGSYVGYQPKPAVEVILVCMKPIEEKSYIDQAMKNGKGVTWLDDCRIPYEKDCRLLKGGSYSGNRTGSNAESFYQTGNEKIEYDESAIPDGRFAANLIVQDDVLDNGKVTKSTGGRTEKKKGWGKFGGGTKEVTKEQPGFGDVGEFSRYFNLDAWWKSRIKHLPESVQKTFPFMIVPKASKSEKNEAINNNHPTVKPIELMSYLITLGSRENDVVVDPFVGSGTTCIAAKLLNRQYIGIEKEEDYAIIAKARIKNVESKENNKASQFFEL